MPAKSQNRRPLSVVTDGALRYRLVRDYRVMRPAGIAPFLLLAACSFDTSGFVSIGATGGSAATSSVASGNPSATSASSSKSGSSATATSVTAATSTTASTTSNTAATSSVSSTSTGVSMPLAACGAFTDTFQNFPNTPMWNTAGASSVSGHAEAKYFAIFAGAWRNGASYDHCYASVTLTGRTGGTVYLNLFHDVTTSVAVQWDGAHVTGPNGNESLNALPKALAIAFENGKVYYLFMQQGNTAWDPPLDVETRSSWMDDTSNNLGFGLNAAGLGDTADFGGFNAIPVTMNDI